MRSRISVCGIALLVSVMGSAQSLACSSSQAAQSDYIGATLIKALDQGRESHGSYPSWVERYIRDADAFGEALNALCAKSPNTTFDNAFAEVAQLKR